MQQPLAIKTSIKVLSLILLLLATILICIDIIDIKMVFGKNEVGLFDRISMFVRFVMFLSYPICLFSSFMLFVLTRKIKLKFDRIANILYLFNGLAILLLFVIG